MQAYDIEGLAKLTGNSLNPTFIQLPDQGSRLPDKLQSYLQITSNPYIRLICEPLQQLQINYFQYSKRFKDSSYIHLTNRTDWQTHYFNQYYYLINEFEDPKRTYETGIYLWVGVNDQDMYGDMRNLFAIDNGITLIVTYEDCSEFFHFGTQSNNRFMINFYLNHIEVLHRFNLFFKDKAWETIDSLSKCRLLMPKRATQDNEQSHMSNGITCFNNLTYIDRYFASNIRSDIYLTKREMECLQFYGMGKTAEEIGLILGISKRTAESYLSNAKSKTNIFKKQQAFPQYRF